MVPVSSSRQTRLEPKFRSKTYLSESLSHVYRCCSNISLEGEPFTAQLRCTKRSPLTSPKSTWNRRHRNYWHIANSFKNLANLDAAESKRSLLYGMTLICNTRHGYPDCSKVPVLNTVSSDVYMIKISFISSTVNSFRHKTDVLCTFMHFQKMLPWSRPLPPFILTQTCLWWFAETLPMFYKCFQVSHNVSWTLKLNKS